MAWASRDQGFNPTSTTGLPHDLRGASLLPLALDHERLDSGPLSYYT